MNHHPSTKLALLTALFLALPLAGCGTGGSFSLHGNGQETTLPPGEEGDNHEDRLRPTAPEAPTGLVVTVKPEGTAEPLVSLSWRDNAADETGFEIQRALGHGSWEIHQNFTPLVTLEADTDEFADADVPGIFYCYRVRAFNEAGFSAFSNTACATVH